MAGRTLRSGPVHTRGAGGNVGLAQADLAGVAQNNLVAGELAAADCGRVLVGLSLAGGLQVCAQVPQKV